MDKIANFIVGLALVWAVAAITAGIVLVVAGIDLLFRYVL